MPIDSYGCCRRRDKQRRLCGKSPRRWVACRRAGPTWDTARSIGAAFGTGTAFALLPGVRKPLYARADAGLRMVARKTVSLSPTAAGVALDASGRVEVHARGWEQHFEVGMDAAVADGTTFLVFANGLPAGTITIASGAGNFYVSNNDQVLPIGVDPVCEMSTVEIRDGNSRVLLRAAF